MTVASTNLDYLLPFLRQRIGDVTVGSYRYTNEWLQTALVASVWALQRYWSNKYLIDDGVSTYNVERNSSWSYTFDEPPIVEPQDIQPIIIMAAIIVLEGSLENMAWSVGSWRDAEISYSNIQSSKVKSEVLKRLKAELDSILIPPQKKLRSSLKGSLVGYMDNPHESGADY